MQKQTNTKNLLFLRTVPYFLPKPQARQNLHAFEFYYTNPKYGIGLENRNALGSKKYLSGLHGLWETP